MQAQLLGDRSTPISARGQRARRFGEMKAKADRQCSLPVTGTPQIREVLYRVRSWWDTIRYSAAIQLLRRHHSWIAAETEDICDEKVESRSGEDARADRGRGTREFWRHGIEATGLADLMKAAGLTHGGFYKHFESKGELVAEACAATLSPPSRCLYVAQGGRKEEGREALKARAAATCRPVTGTIRKRAARSPRLGSELARATTKPGRR